MTLNESQRQHLAIMVEDNTLEYGTYEGIIPEGQYGSGAVVVWETGDYEPSGRSIAEGKLEIIPSGIKKVKIDWLSNST